MADGGRLAAEGAAGAPARAALAAAEGPHLQAAYAPPAHLAQLVVPLGGLLGFGRPRGGGMVAACVGGSVHAALGSSAALDGLMP